MAEQGSGRRIGGCDDHSQANSQQSPQTKITVLKSASGKLATKRFTQSGVEGYARERDWLWQEIPIATFGDLVRLLEEVERDPFSLIVQGVVAPAWRDKEIILRRKSKGEPSLIDEGSRVVTFDIDDPTLPDGTGWHDPEGIACAIWKTVIVARIPAFKGVSFWWQASSSAGAPGKEHLAKLHIWVLLDRPIKEVQRKALLKLAGTDESLATINQPNYVAGPIFEGVRDPLADVPRSGAVIGNKDHAACEQIAWPAADVMQAKARKSKGLRGAVVIPQALDQATTDEGRVLLDRVCDQIKGLSPGGRNNRINKISFTIGGHVAGGAIGYAEARSTLLKAGLASGHKRYVEAVENGLRDGIQHPIYPEKWTGREAKDQEILPFHPAPDGHRDEAIAAHPATIRAWADRNIPVMQATKAVARAYSEIDHHQDPKEVARIKFAIRKRIKVQFGLDFLPASKITNQALITRMMLSGGQGVGKTLAVVGDGELGILHQTVGLTSILYEPDHTMAAQAKRDYDNNAREDSPLSIHLWGRGSPDPDHPDNTMCRLHEIAQPLAQRGVSVRQSLCENCPYADVCGYLRQEKEMARLAAAPQGVVVFAPHDYAFIPLPSLVEPNLVIFDERPRDYGVGENVGVSFDDLSETLELDQALTTKSAIQSIHEQADAQGANLRFIRPLMIALRNAGQDYPNRMLGALRDQGIDRDHLEGAIEGLTYFKDRESAQAMQKVMSQYKFSQANGRAFDLGSRLEHEIESRQVKITRDLQTVFEALLIEIDKEREEANAITVGDIKRPGGGSARGIIAVKLKKFRLGRVPVLYLDGTGDHRMAQSIFGQLDHEHHRVERSPADRGDRIVQVVGNDFHTAGLVGGRNRKDGKIEPYTGTWSEHYDIQRRDLQKIIAERPGALVVANKRAIEALKPESHGARSAHFGAVRGRNDWAKIDRVFVVGREQPSPAAVERTARAFAAHEDAPFKSLGGKPYPTVMRGIRMRNGIGHPVDVAFHPDPWAERVLRSIRDTEIEQAIDRIRPIFKYLPIQIVLLSPVAVDLTVDHVITWKEFRHGGTRVERALNQARVVPLSGREAARLLPGIWGGEKTARDDLKAAGLSRQTLNRETYLEFDALRTGVVASYRVEVEAGRRSREQTALIIAPPYEARVVLEALTGPLRAFQVVKVFEPDQAAVEAAKASQAGIEIAKQDDGLSVTGATQIADGVETPTEPNTTGPDRNAVPPPLAKQNRRRKSGG